MATRTMRDAWREGRNSLKRIVWVKSSSGRWQSACQDPTQSGDETGPSWKEQPCSSSSGQDGGAAPLPPERLVSGEAPRAVKCMICNCVVPYGDASITPCRHLFCTACIKTWLERGPLPACPHCRRPLLLSQLRPLREADPALERTLAAVQVRCKHSHCMWRGDYSSLAAHELGCPAEGAACPDCGCAVARGECEVHVLQCLRHSVDRLKAEKAQWEAERQRLRQEVDQLEHQRHQDTPLQATSPQHSSALPSTRTASSPAHAARRLAQTPSPQSSLEAPGTPVPPQHEPHACEALMRHSVGPPLAPAPAPAPAPLLGGPDDVLGLARLLGGSVGPHAPRSVDPQAVFLALAACVASWERRAAWCRDDARNLLLALAAADACEWLSASQRACVGTWLGRLGASLVRQRVEGTARV